MTVTLDHTIVTAQDKEATASFYTEVLGLPPHQILGHFAIVRVDATSLDFVESGGAIAPRHFAFLVSEGEFDEIFGRIQNKGLAYWADPYRREPGAINRRDDGRGVYFEDPNGHLLEIITRPYGAGGQNADHPIPLLGE